MGITCYGSGESKDFSENICDSKVERLNENKYVAT
jgi:hypothetical protein